ncbi:hypothetical protein FDECE_7387 [Fusarium decemcellulare]|nr:hypothetical protein FDECE_7387 [Fusarium decemcellulare]
MPSSIASSGTKRSRSGQPKSLGENQMPQDNSNYDEWSSEDEEQDYRSSESESDSDDDTSSEDESDPDQEYTLPENHKFQSLRPELVQFSYTKFQSWRAVAQYVAPPDDRLPPRKRIRVDEGAKVDDCDKEFVVVSQPRGFFHLACPFNVSDPAKYKQCLLQHDLQSIEQVISHVGYHHMQPFYCPRCSETFGSVIGRDDHILGRECKVLPIKKIEGINTEQRSNLTKRDRVYRGEAKRWRRIWTTVFLNSEPPRSPYLDKGCGLEISMARDYWSINGRCCVSEFLESRGMTGDGEEDSKAQRELCKLTLQDLLEKISGEHETA